MEELGCTWAWYAVLPLLLPAPRSVPQPGGEHRLLMS